MNRQDFDKKFYSARDKAYDLFYNEKNFQRIIKEFKEDQARNPENKDQSFNASVLLANKYSDQLLYTVLKDFELTPDDPEK